jgi:hypothetical protein
MISLILLTWNPPESYDHLLRTLSYTAPTSALPFDTDWTHCAFSSQIYSSFAIKQYKPVARKVQPIPSYMPNPDGQIFKPVIIEPPPPIPLDPPYLADFKVSELGCLTQG